MANSFLGGVKMNNTHEIFDANYADYIMRTINVDFSSDYDVFLKHVPEGGHILDLGCGSGRDAFRFKKMGYKVTAVDGGRKFCEFASNLLQQPVECMLFQDMKYENEFDGIWAMASIHHLDKDELMTVIEKVYKALKVGGAFLFNARLGEREYDNKNGKHFCEFNQKTFRQFIKSNPNLKNFKFRDEYTHGDYRDGRDEGWYTAILVKTK